MSQSCKHQNLVFVDIDDTEPGYAIYECLDCGEQTIMEERDEGQEEIEKILKIDANALDIDIDDLKEE